MVELFPEDLGKTHQLAGQDITGGLEVPSGAACQQILEPCLPVPGGERDESSLVRQIGSSWEQIPA